MKPLILTIAALVVATSAQAAPSGTSPKAGFCSAIGTIAKIVAEERDAGTSQLAVVEYFLTRESLPQAQRVAVDITDAIYNDAQFQGQPPAKIGAAFLLSCMRMANPQGAL